MTKRYWRGFVAGAAAGAGLAIGGLAILNAFVRNSRIVRLEKSLQIGRPAEEVFQQWSGLERLPRWSDCVEEITTTGDRSHWRVRVDGRLMEWDARIEQFIPNQAIGWKSVAGPKHTGRITFSPIGDNTLVQVTMNYVPPSLWLRPFVTDLGIYLDRYLEQVLRDFKAGLEGKGQEGVKPASRLSIERLGPGTPLRQSEAARATGTHGPASTEPAESFGTRTSEYTVPPEKKR